MADDKLVPVSGALALPDNNDAFGVDFGEIKKITPYTLSIDQPMTQKDGVQPGMLRIVETGLLRKEVKVVLIQKPKETRAYQIGEFPDQTTICFSRNMVSPDPRSQTMQAMACAGCKHASWDAYNKTQNFKDAPGCKITSQIVAIDFDILYPIQAYIRGKSRSGGLEEGLKQMIQQFVTLKMTKGSAAWTDVIATFTTEKAKKNPNYVLKIKDVHPLTTEEREHLSGILTLVGQQKAAMLQRIADNEAKAAAAAVDDEVTKAATGQTSGPIEGEYVSGQGTVDEV